MRIRAIAAPSNESNAVGSVELECTPAGLVIAYLGVASYADGYAPAAIARNTQVLAPWVAVQEVRATPEHILIVLAPDVTPHNRLCLTRFGDDSAPPAVELLKRRRIVRLATAALMLASALSVGAHWPRWSGASSQVTALVVGAGAALIVLGAGLFVDHWLSAGGPNSRQVRDAFLSELKFHRPKPVIVGASRQRDPDERFEWVDLIRLLPRSTFAIVIVFSAMTLGAVLTSNWLLTAPEVEREATTRPEPPPVAASDSTAANTIPTEPTPAATQPPTANPEPEPEPTPEAEGTIVAGEPCECERSDSALWSLQFPRLSTLLIEQRNRPHKEHQHLEIELAVINNGNTTLDEVNLMVHFYEGEGGEKRLTKDRPLHYGAPLRPAQAIKWHVQARGTSFSVSNPLAQVLPEDEKELAGVEAFAELLRANHRPVRLHGAMMLAYLGDQRAKAGALELRKALRESEGPYLDRVLATQSDLISCDWQWSDGGRVRDVAACVYNSSSKPIERAGLAVRALDRVFDYRNPVAPPPLVIAEAVMKLPGTFPPEQGRRVVAKLDTDNPDGRIAETLEIVTDLYEHL